MNRRSALKNMILASGGILTIPSWLQKWSYDSLGTLNTSFTDYEIAIISSIADTIIPHTGTIGALSVGVDKFLVALISECYPDNFIGEIRLHIESLDSLAYQNYNLYFTDCSKPQRESLLAKLSNSVNENDRSFIEFLKQQTIRGFETSEEVLVNYHGYILMPGFYDGDVEVTN